jgi:hypothetical protein
MSSAHQAAVTANLQHRLDNQKAAPEQEIDINNPLHPLHPDHADLRIVPEGYEVPDSTSPLNHHDLRIRLAQPS